MTEVYTNRGNGGEEGNILFSSVNKVRVCQIELSALKKINTTSNNLCLLRHAVCNIGGYGFHCLGFYDPVWKIVACCFYPACLSVYPSVWNLNLASNCSTISDRVLIFHKYIPLDKTFLLISNVFTFCPRPWRLTYFLKNQNPGITLKRYVIWFYTSYLHGC